MSAANNQHDELYQKTLVEMNKKLQKICNLTDDECYLLHKPSSLRSVLEHKLTFYQMAQGPITSTNGNVLALSMGSDGKCVAVEAYTEQVAKLKKQIEEEDKLVVDTVTHYNNLFIALAKQHNTTVKQIYERLNVLGAQHNARSSS